MIESKITQAIDHLPAANVGPAHPKSISTGRIRPDSQPTDRSTAISDHSQITGTAHQNWAQTNASFNKIAQSIAKVDQTMEQMATRINKMSQKLQAFRKIYPPYPPGSEERVELLKKFSAFRKQIEKLSYPPQDEGAQKIIAQPGELNQNGGWEPKINGTKENFKIHSITAHPEAGGLDIPRMSKAVRDEEIIDIIGRLGKAYENLQTQRKTLADDAGKIFGAKTKLSFHEDGPEFEKSITPLNNGGETGYEVRAKSAGLQISTLAGDKNNSSLVRDPMVLKPLLG